MSNINEDEIICSQCNGEGFIIEEVGKEEWDERKIPIKNICDKCLGTGKLDWIENIVGKSHVKFTVNIQKQLKKVNK